MMQRARHLLLSLMSPGLFIGCGPPDRQAIVDDYIAGTGLSFAECGRSESVQCATTTTEASLEAIAQCLVEAFLACAPSRGEYAMATVEGDPIVHVVLVQPADSGCKVVEFIDTTEDDFGPQAVRRHACATLARQDSCPWLSSCPGPAVETFD